MMKPTWTSPSPSRSRRNCKAAPTWTSLPPAPALGFAGTVVATDSRVDRDTRNATVRARVDAASAPAPGSAVRVHVPNGAPRVAVAVPVSALRKGPAGDHVFVVAKDRQGESRAYVRPVEAGAVLGDEVLIEAGIKPGEQVAASGSFKLRDAALVAIASETPPLDGAPKIAAR